MTNLPYVRYTIEKFIKDITKLNYVLGVCYNYKIDNDVGNNRRKVLASHG